MKKFITSLVALGMLASAQVTLAADTQQTVTASTCVQRVTNQMNWFESLNQGYKPVPSNAQTVIAGYCAKFTSPNLYLGAEYEGLNQGGVWIWDYIEKYIALKTLGYTNTWPGIHDYVRTTLVQEWENFKGAVTKVSGDVDAGNACTGNYCALLGHWTK